MNDEDVQHLCSKPWCHGLTELDLVGNNITGLGLSYILQMKLQELRYLQLCKNILIKREIESISNKLNRLFFTLQTGLKLQHLC